MKLIRIVLSLDFLGHFGTFGIRLYGAALQGLIAHHIARVPNGRLAFRGAGAECRSPAAAAGGTAKSAAPGWTTWASGYCFSAFGPGGRCIVTHVYYKQGELVSASKAMPNSYKFFWRFDRVFALTL
jgi:hypothetical protein